MNPQVEDPVREVKRLQRCMNDLVSLLALPSVWSESEPSQILQVLLDVLLRMLSLDFAYVRLNGAFSATPVEIFRIAEGGKTTLPSQPLRDVLIDMSRAFARGSDEQTNRPSGLDGFSIFPVPLGLQGEIGLILLGSDRADFPEEAESLLLSVAANQAAIELQGRRLLNEQRRIAAELELRVAERTRALAQTNEELRRSEERWRSVFENSAVGVAITDLSGRFIATNLVYQKMLGYTAVELRQLTLLGITHEQSIEACRMLIGELVEGKRQQFQVEKQYRRKNGQPVSVRNNVSIVPGTERLPRFLMAISEDVTQRKLSEEALARARSELAKVASITSLGVLTACIAHEINQPLSGIVTNASTCLRMLSAEPPNVDGALETVRRTLRDGKRASDVISRLRTLYSKTEPTLELMNLNDATREVVALSLSELRQNTVSLRYELAENLPAVTGDRIQLQQVILNLLRNAADAMGTIDDRPRELLIKTECDKENHVRLSVKDSGVGLTVQTAEKIFVPFYTTKSDGMGIGLSISRSIIEAHEGRLWATPNDGPGATFSFAIPYAIEDLSASQTRMSRAAPAKDAA